MKSLSLRDSRLIADRNEIFGFVQEVLQRNHKKINQQQKVSALLQHWDVVSRIPETESQMFQYSSRTSVKVPVKLLEVLFRIKNQEQYHEG